MEGLHNLAFAVNEALASSCVHPRLIGCLKHAQGLGYVLRVLSTLIGCCDVGKFLHRSEGLVLQLRSTLAVPSGWML